MKFFVLRPAEGQLFGTKWAYGVGAEPKVTKDIGPRCPVCGQAVGPLVWVPPHRLEVSSAKPEKWGDFLWGAWLSAPMVSARFKAIYEAEALIGVRCHSPSVQIVRVGRKKRGDLPLNPPTYHVIEIERLGPELDEDASGMTRTHLECPYCHRGDAKRWTGVVIKLGSWSGEDIFFPRGLPGTCVTSERFRQIVESRGLTNARFVPADRYAYDVHRPQLPLHYAREG